MTGHSSYPSATNTLHKRREGMIPQPPPRGVGLGSNRNYYNTRPMYQPPGGYVYPMANNSLRTLPSWVIPQPPPRGVGLGSIRNYRNNRPVYQPPTRPKSPNMTNNQKTDALLQLLASHLSGNVHKKNFAKINSLTNLTNNNKEKLKNNIRFKKTNFLTNNNKEKLKSVSTVRVLTALQHLFTNKQKMTVLRYMTYLKKYLKKFSDFEKELNAMKKHDKK